MNLHGLSSGPSVTLLSEHTVLSLALQKSCLQKAQMEICYFFVYCHRLDPPVCHLC